MNALPTEHIGDGVYVTFDGFGIELRVNDHLNPVAAYLEPHTLAALNQYAERARGPSTASQEFPAAMVKAMQQIEARRKQLLELEPHFKAVEEIAARFPELGVGLTWWDGIGSVVASVYVKSLADVQPFLAAIVRAGYHPGGRTDYTDEHTPRCTYDYGTTRDGRREIVVNARISYSEEAVCRLEKVGEKTVPIMRIVCDGAPA